ncbi:4818_t:CDS:2 [Paraglomus occultum]|uniref:peptide chain release factor N(5)-glutamine methyltransferase n=1 Tax=Paraglomus occultum TaxID=144539 RepID=A0A9N9AAA5_9GLOM|nr:4818_t:CDS:2 [Paraglomus occultum]
MAQAARNGKNSKPFSDEAWKFECKRRKDVASTGTQPFCNLDIVTRPPVLIPRWETEEWTMRVISLLYSRLHYLEKPIHILDVCTGSGCIALSLAHNMPANTCFVRGIDISSQALILANLNLQVFRSNNLIKNDVIFSKVDIMNDDEIASFVQNNQPAFDLILSNPPYIPREQYDKLGDEVKLWEDEIALIADDNGTAFHSRIVNLAANGLLKRLKEHNVVPRLVMEFGADQGATIIREMERSKFTSIEVWKDGVGRDRCVVGSISQ